MPDAFVSCISLSPSTLSKKDVDLKINMSLDGMKLQNVKTLVNKHGLGLKESQGSLLIYGSRQNEIANPRLNKNQKKR
jgi:hypothetical protein